MMVIFAVTFAGPMVTIDRGLRRKVLEKIRLGFGEGPRTDL